MDDFSIRRYKSVNCISNRSLDILKELEKKYFNPRGIIRKPDMLNELIKTFCESKKIKIGFNDIKNIDI